VDSCRRVFSDLGVAAGDGNLGLWLDCGLKHQPDNAGRERTRFQRAKDELLDQVCRVGYPTGYDAHIRRVRADLEASRAVCVEGRTLGRTIVGLGAKNGAEFGITLDRTWGVPILPGSSLKGIAAAAAKQLAAEDSWRAAGDAYNWLFGTTDETGHVQFLDAWLIPGTARGGRLLQRDVMTPHHQAYYQHSGHGEPPPPSDMDGPNPIGFVSVSGAFLIAVVGEQPWADAAMVLLKQGLEVLGIGAKTNGGYGRIEVDFEPAQLTLDRQRREREQADAEAARRRAEEQEQRDRQAQEAERLAAAEATKALAAARARLEQFKRAYEIAAEPERPQLIVATWSSLGGLQREAAEWILQTLGVDRAAAEVKYGRKPWYLQLVRKALQ